MHLGVERILRRLGLEMQTVPFQGAGQTLPAFLGGHITFFGGSLVGAMPAVRAGTARCYFLTTVGGSPAAPHPVMMLMSTAGTAIAAPKPEAVATD